MSAVLRPLSLAIFGAVAAASCGEPSASDLCPSPDPKAHVVHITADQGSAMALFSDGSAWCWGDSPNGECTGLPNFHKTPAKTRISCAESLDRGGDGGILKKFDGTLEVWSQNKYGELADGGTPVGTDSEPETIAGATSIADAKAVGTAEVALGEKGHVEWWGTLPISEDENAVQAKPTIMGGLPPVSQISGKTHVCALSRDHQVYCWGENQYGQLGDGTTDPRRGAGLVSSLQNIVQIAAGDGFTCAVDGDGAVSCWGLNDSGLLGRGEAIAPPSIDHLHEPTPALVVGCPPSKAVYAGDGFACALTMDGVPYCWGQIGAFDADLKFPVSTATLIVGLSNVSELALATQTLCALLGDHTVSCIGEGFARGHDSFNLEQLVFQ